MTRLFWKLQRGSEAFRAQDEGAPAQDLEQLWRTSAHPSAFAAPEVLLQLAHEATRAGSLPLAVRGLDAAGQTRALWPLVRDPQGRAGFLQQGICDHATALYHPEVASVDLAEGLVEALANAAPTSLYLANLTSWENTREAAERALTAAGWHHRAFAASSNPVLHEPPGPDLVARLTSHVRGKSLRNYANRLAREAGYAFEARVDDDDLEAWVDAFCDCHDWRWSRTDTPSEFKDPDARRTFARLVCAWQRAGVLVRCAIRLGEKRIAFAVVLHSGDRLVYHRIAHSPAFEKTAATTVLIRNIVLWMAEDGQTTLDFGIGSEAYKFRFANQDQRLARIYASPARVSRTLLAARVEAAIRSSAGLQRGWDQLANQWLRATLYGRLGHARDRLRQVGRKRAGREGFWPPGPAAPTPGPSAYAASGVAGRSRPALQTLPLEELMAVTERQVALPSRERARFYEAREAGWRALGVDRQGDATQWVWLRGSAEDREQPIWLWAGPREKTASTVALLHDLRAQAGAGTRLLAHAAGPGSFSRDELQAAGFEALAAPGEGNR